MNKYRYFNPMWFAHKSRLYKFKSMMRSPSNYGTSFFMPSNMRIKITSEQDGSTVTFSIAGNSKVYALNNGEEKVIENVWKQTKVVTTGKIRIYADMGHLLSTWGLIFKSNTDSSLSGYGYNYGLSGYGDVA